MIHSESQARVAYNMEPCLKRKKYKREETGREENGGSLCQECGEATCCTKLGVTCFLLLCDTCK